MPPPQIKDRGTIILFHFPSVNLGTMIILGKVPTVCQHHAGTLLITELHNGPVHCSSEQSHDSHQVTQLSVLSSNQLWSPGKMYPGDVFRMYLLHRISQKLLALLTTFYFLYIFLMFKSFVIRLFVYCLGKIKVKRN